MLLLALSLTLGAQEGIARASDGLPPIRVSGADLTAGNQRFISYGFNTAQFSQDYLDDPTGARLRALQRYIERAKLLHANTLRIYVELTQVMRSPTDVKEQAIRALQRLFALAESKGIYLDVTGNLNWRPTYQRDWYDNLDEQARWQVQARFWRAVARAGKRYDSVMMYELCSEPYIVDDPLADWYSGDLGGYQFTQAISRDLQGRDPEAIALAWSSLLARSVRSRDPRHLVTIGALPWSDSALSDNPDLDLITFHDFPTAAGVDAALERVKAFAAAGKPVVLGETYALVPDFESYAGYLKSAKPYLDGYLNFYDGGRANLQEASASSDPLAYIVALNLRAFLRLRGFLLSP